MTQTSATDRHGGFTLLELMLVLVILGFAGVLIAPTFSTLETRSFNAQVRADLPVGWQYMTLPEAQALDGRAGRPAARPSAHVEGDVQLGRAFQPASARFCALIGLTPPKCS